MPSDPPIGGRRLIRPPGLVGRDRFRVCLIYRDEPDRPYTVRLDVGPEEAYVAFMAYVQAAEVASEQHAHGPVMRVFVTSDEGDTASMDWQHGKGIVFPDRETLERVYGKA